MFAVGDLHRSAWKIGGSAWVCVMERAAGRGGSMVGPIRVRCLLKGMFVCWPMHVGFGEADDVWVERVV